jgi:hypothetical protein
MLRLSPAAVICLTAAVPQAVSCGNMYAPPCHQLVRPLSPASPLPACPPPAYLVIAVKPGCHGCLQGLEALIDLVEDGWMGVKTAMVRMRTTPAGQQGPARASRPRALPTPAVPHSQVQWQAALQA